MMYYHKFIILSLLGFFNAFSQTEIWTGAGLDLGIPISSSYGSGKNMLSPRFCKVMNENIYLQLRFFKRIGLELYATQNSQFYRYKDKEFYRSTGDKYDVRIRSTNHFVSYGANIIYRQPIIGSYAGIYASAGYRINNTGMASASAKQMFRLNGEEFEFVSKNYGSGGGLLFEAGCQVITDDEKNMITIGLQYQKGLTKLYEGELTRKAAISSAVMYTDQVSSALSYFGLTFKYHYRIFHYDKSEKIPDEEPVGDINKHSEYVHPSQRKVEVKDKIEVKSKKISIAIYDPYREDNDRVSISINGKYALENFTVTKKQYVFEVELYPGTNTLVFQAENLGEIPPNTATIFVIENGKKKKFDMSANLNTSQSIEITYKP